MIHKRVRLPARANVACLQWIFTVSLSGVRSHTSLQPRCWRRSCWEQKLLSPALTPAELDTSFCWGSVKASAMAIKTAGMHSAKSKGSPEWQTRALLLPTLSSRMCWLVTAHGGVTSYCIPVSSLWQASDKITNPWNTESKTQSVRDSVVLLGWCEIWYPCKNDTAKSRGEGRPWHSSRVVAAWVPRPPQQCMGTAVCHTPGQAVTQPLAPPGLGTEQGAWGHFLA